MGYEEGEGYIVVNVSGTMKTYIGIWSKRSLNLDSGSQKKINGWLLKIGVFEYIIQIER